MSAGKRCGRARKMDAEAINQAKHMRQRCRAMRCVPETPPRTSMRTSPARARSATEPMKKYGPAGYPYFNPVLLRIAWKAHVNSVATTANTSRRAAQSKLLIFSFLRFVVIHAVAIKENVNLTPSTLADWYFM